MKGALHITPVLILPPPGLWTEGIELTVDATHRVLAPYRPLIRRTVGMDAYAIAGLSDSIFGWTVDLSFERDARPLTFQLNWTVKDAGVRRQCQHRLTISLEKPGRLAAPLWSTDPTLWPDDGRGGYASKMKLTPFSVFEADQLIDDMQRTLSITTCSHVTVIDETLSIPAIERTDLTSQMAERYEVARSAAA